MSVWESSGRGTIGVPELSRLPGSSGKLPFAFGKTSLRGKAPLIRMLLDTSEVLTALTKELPLAVKIGAIRGTQVASQHLLRVADKYVPVETGQLRKSGKIIGRTLDADAGSRIATSDIMSFSPGNVEYTVGIQYGGWAADITSKDRTKRPYAMWVHEDPNAAHGKEWNEKYAGKKLEMRRKRPEEQYNWMNVAMVEGGPEAMGLLYGEVFRAFKRVLKNPKRFGARGTRGLAALKATRTATGLGRY